MAVARRKLRVLHVIPWRAARYGGPTYAIDGMCKHLRQRGLEVLVASTDADGGQHLKIELGTIVDFHDVPSIFFRRDWHDSFQFSAGLARWMSQHIAEFDLVHVHGVFSHPCIAAAQACQHANVPYLVRPFGSLDPWSMSHSRWRKRIFWRLAVGRMLQEAGAIHYTTDEECRLAETSLGLARGLVVPLGIDMPGYAGASNPQLFRTTFGIRDGYQYVLTLSRLHPKKGVDILISAFADLYADSERRDVLLVVAGDGDPAYVEQLKTMALQRKIADRVLFTGWLGGHTKVAALGGATAFALFSYQENFAISVAEALACGTPVAVSSSVNLAPEVQRFGAGWVSSLNPASVRETLRTVLVDSESRKRKGAAARVMARAMFSWPSNTEKLVAAYSRLIDWTPTRK